MYLTIDLSSFGLIKFKLLGDQVVSEKAVSGGNRDLLKCIDVFLTDSRVRPDELKGLAVVTGKVSFTGARIATVVANTFGFVLNIPLLQISEADLVDLPKLVKKIERQPRGQYLAASYSGEPNIGKYVI